MTIQFTAFNNKDSKREVLRPDEPPIPVVTRRKGIRFLVSGADTRWFDTREEAEKFAQIVAEECNLLPTLVTPLPRTELDAHSDRVRSQGWANAVIRFENQ